MAEQEVHRRLVDGVWRTTVGEESGSGGGGNGGGDAASLLTETVELSSAQLLALTGFDNPSGWVPAIASPGSGFAISALDATAVYTAGGTPYTLTGTVVVALTTLPAVDVSANSRGLVVEFEGAGLLDAAGNAWKQLPNGNRGPGSNIADPADWEDKGATVVLDRAGATLTDGDGSLTITVLYYVVAVPA